MDHLSRIGVFLEVVKQQSFAGAARRLGITSSAVSKQVQNLERELQVKLLNRTTRQVSVTEEGAIFSERAARALEDLREAEDHIHDMKAAPRGSLKMGMPQSFGIRYLTGPVADFARTYPEVELDVRMDDRMVNVAAEEFDAVIRIGALKDSSLIARKLATCPVALCASPAYLERKGTPRSPGDLAEHDGVIYTRTARQYQWGFRHRETGETGTAEISPVFHSDSGDMILEATLQGIGISAQPMFYVFDHLRDGRLVTLLPDWETMPERNIYVLFSRNRYLSKRLRLFIDHLTDICAGLPWECG